MVFKKGIGYKERFLFLKIAKNGLNVSRFGFVVSQKVSKKAVIRNKIKRRLRELIRKNLPRIKSGFDGVFIVNRGLEIMNFLELENVINRILEKSSILKKNQ